LSNRGEGDNVVSWPDGRLPFRWARSVPVRWLRQALLRGVMRPLVWRITRVRVEATAATPRTPVVLVANHASHLDTALILCSLPPRLAGRVAVGAAADYFFDVWWRSAGSAVMFNTFPVVRPGGRGRRGVASALLKQGWSLLLYPEGTRSRDGSLGTFKPGAAALCVNHGVPAVPIHLAGTFEAMPRGRSWPRPGRPGVVVTYGAPLHPFDGETAESFNLRLRAEVRRLGNEAAENASDEAAGDR
jgi:1-acyl-sn-glycerol-3-phosphate acyltransferase